MKNAKYTINALKYHTCHEGDPHGAWQCNLLKNGKKIGMVLDDGWGGCLMFQLDKGEEKLFDDYCKQLPPWRSEWDDKEHEMDSEIHMSEMVEKFDWLKRIKRQLKKKMCIHLKNHHKEGEYFVYKGVYSEELLKRVTPKLIVDCKTDPWDIICLNTLDDETLWETLNGRFRSKQKV